MAAILAVWTSASAALSAVGKPLVVTPLLPHRYAEAQAASRVRLPGYNATDLFSGFFEIDATTSSRTFFLFSKAASGREDAPVLLWLNGGPGASSLIGFLTELGPFGITDDLDVAPRSVHWNLDAHLLTLDNPLGTGYSSTADDQRMATNQTTVGADLHAALEQFYTLFPELRANPFYATGESYAGKYIPAVAHTIHTRNAGLPPHRRINLRGLAIGDGAFDPPSQLIGFGPTLFALGMVRLPPPLKAMLPLFAQQPHSLVIADGFAQQPRSLFTAGLLAQRPRSPFTASCWWMRHHSSSPTHPPSPRLNPSLNRRACYVCSATPTWFTGTEKGSVREQNKGARAHTHSSPCPCQPA